MHHDKPFKRTHAALDACSLQGAVLLAPTIALRSDTAKVCFAPYSRLVRTAPPGPANWRSAAIGESREHTSKTPLLTTRMGR